MLDLLVILKTYKPQNVKILLDQSSQRALSNSLITKKYLFFSHYQTHIIVKSQGS